MHMTRRVLTKAGALAAGACVFTVTVVAQGQAPAPAPRTLQAGVYSAAQAARGETLYAQRCAGCHGPALGGGTAPALTGEAFARTWRMEPLSALFIKVRHTMPPNAEPKLSDAQAADLVAHLLARSGFPAGTELAAAEAAADMTAWPAAATPGPRTYPPTGNLAQLMRSVFFPNSNLIFTVQTRDPAEPVPPPSPAAGGAGFSVFEWGQGIYTGWPVIENAAAAIADASPLMLLEGMKCENGRMAPVTDADWIRFTDEMIAVAKRTYRLAQTRDQEAVSFATGDLSDACANCHRAYRDVGRGRGADPFAPGANAGRCTPR